MDHRKRSPSPAADASYVDCDVSDAMDVDSSSQIQIREVNDYGLEVDFEMLEDDEKEDGSAQKQGELEKEIEKLSAEIERMAPNMRAIDRLDDASP